MPVPTTGDRRDGSHRRAVIRNIVIYVAGTMALSIVGGIAVSGGAEVGALVFLIGPTLMAVLLRCFGGDGWTDAGLRIGPARWYVFALAVFPVTFGVILAVAELTGTVTLTGTFSGFLASVPTGVGAWMLYATFEEVGWRGYLEPRLLALGIPDAKRHVVVGVIWAVWHIPYIVAVPDYTELPWPTFAPLLMGGIVVMALVHGQLRQASGSVWPVVVAHGLGNALAHPLVVSDDALAAFSHPAVLATRPENLLFIAIWALIGWGLRRRSAARDARGRNMVTK